MLNRVPNIKTHDAHVAELVHQNFGMLGRFSGFDVRGMRCRRGGAAARSAGTGTGPWSRRGCEDGGMSSWRAATAGQVPKLQTAPDWHHTWAAAQRMPNRGEMHANLMGTSGLQIHGYQCGLMAETLQHILMRNGRFAVAGVTQKRKSDTLARPIGASMVALFSFKTAPKMSRMDIFFYLMLGELPTHLGVRKVGLAHQHWGSSISQSTK